MDGPAGEGRHDRLAAAQPELVQPAVVTNAVARPGPREHERRGPRRRGPRRARGANDHGGRPRAIPAATRRREGCVAGEVGNSHRQSSGPSRRPPDRRAQPRSAAAAGVTARHHRRGRGKQPSGPRVKAPRANPSLRGGDADPRLSRPCRRDLPIGRLLHLPDHVHRLCHCDAAVGARGDGERPTRGGDEVRCLA